MEPVHIRTARLLLRPWRETDKPLFAALNADPQTMIFFPAPLSREESDALADRIAANIERDGWGFWAVERPEDGRFIGFVGLNRTQGLPFSPAVEVGWRLARPFWGRGYASEAGRAALDFAFSTLRLEEVVAFTALANRRSRSVMERLGLKPRGHFEHPGLPEGHPLRPHVLYGIRRSQNAPESGAR